MSGFGVDYQRQKNMFKKKYEKHGDWCEQQMKKILGAVLKPEK